MASLNKVFIPPGGRVEGGTLVLASGEEVPLWVVIGVPSEEAGSVPPGESNAVAANRYVDVLTGAERTEAPVPERRDPPRGESSGYAVDFTEFSRWAPLRAVLRVAEECMPDSGLSRGSSVTDPGYTQPSGVSVPSVDPGVDPDADWSDSEFEVGAGFKLRDALTWLGRPQQLTPRAGLTTLQVVENVVSVASDVLALVPSTLSYRVRSWAASPDSAPTQPEIWTGATAAAEFDSDADAYAAARYLSTRASFDSLRLDYRPAGGASVVATAAHGGQSC